MTLQDVTNSNNVSHTIVNGAESFLISWINNYKHRAPEYTD
jgi:hypothetical protein